MAQVLHGRRRTTSRHASRHAILVLAALSCALLYVLVGCVEPDLGDPLATPSDYSIYQLQWEGVLARFPYPSAWSSTLRKQEYADKTIAFWHGPRSKQTGSYVNIEAILIRSEEGGTDSCAKPIKDRLIPVNQTVPTKTTIAGQPAWKAEEPYMFESEVNGNWPGTGRLACVLTPRDRAVLVILIDSEGDQRPIGEAVFERVISSLTIGTDENAPER